LPWRRLTLAPARSAGPVRALGMRRVLRSEAMQSVTNASAVANSGAGTSPADHARSERTSEPQFPVVPMLHAWPEGSRVCGSNPSSPDQPAAFLGQGAHDDGKRTGVSRPFSSSELLDFLIMRPTIPLLIPAGGPASRPPR